MTMSLLEIERKASETQARAVALRDTIWEQVSPLTCSLKIREEMEL